MGPIGHLLLDKFGFIKTEGLLWMVYFSLINFFHFSGNVAADPSQANVASSVIFKNFSPNLFLNQCNHSLLAVNGLVPLISGGPLLKSSYRLNAFLHKIVPSIGTRFLFMSPTHNFNASFILSTYALPITFAV